MLEWNVFLVSADTVVSKILSCLAAIMDHFSFSF